MKNIFQEIIANVFSDIPSKHTVWLDSIGDQDDLLALHAATYGLEKALSDASLSPQTLSKILDITEEKSAPILLRLNEQFIKFEYMDDSLENNILAVVYAFHKQLYNNYIYLFDYHANQPEMTDSVIAPLMHNAVKQTFEMLKWRSFVNFGLAPKMWLQLHRIYSLAANYDLLESTLIEPDFDHPTPTLAGRLVQTYMLDNLQQVNLSRIGVAVACKLLQSQLLHVDISQELNPLKYLFFVDIEKDTGAKRMRHFTPTNTCIFWHIDNVETYIANIIERKFSANSLVLLDIEPHQTKDAVEALNIIHREWSRKEYLRQRRKEARHKLTTTANVVYGIHEVCKRIYAHENGRLNGTSLSADGKTLDERLKSHTTQIGEPNAIKGGQNHHHWVITDESNQGLGAVANRELNAWISVGQILGLVLANGKSEVIIGVVKSTRPKTNQQMQVGIELISRHAKWVQLKPTGMVQSDSTLSAHNFAALYLPLEAGVTSNSALLIPKIEFIPNSPYEISISGMIEQITLGEPIDSKDDWVKVIYPR